MKSRGVGGRESGSSEALKRELPPPSSLGSVAAAVVLQAARSFLFIRPQSRLLYYAVVVVLGSLVRDFLLPLSAEDVPGFAAKASFLNQWVVKLGWGWTFTLCGAFVTLSSLVYSSGDWRGVRPQLARLFVATGLWYFATGVFLRYEAATGFCTSAEALGSGRSHCTRSGGTWLPGFDISGHSFLIIYCVLLISEEVRVFKSWNGLRQLLDAAPSEPFQLGLLSKEEIKATSELYTEYTDWIKGLFISLAVLVGVFDFMLIVTVLFYHTFYHKVAGAAVAMLCWQVTYRLWFTLPLSPGLPGACRIQYHGYRRTS